MSRQLKPILMAVLCVIAVIVLWRVVAVVARLIAIALLLGVVFFVASAWFKKR